MFRILNDNRHKDLLDCMAIMAYMAELKEWDNRYHTERIRRYCYIIGSGLDISQRENEIIALASQLHDIGKINIPEELLNRKGNYETFEWDIIEKHTTDGANILHENASQILQAAEIIASTHHERWDGSGYPQRLIGDKIPLSGRICSLADVFDALTTQRTYKESVKDAVALELIKDSSGKMFDPSLVKVFTAKFNEILKAKNSLSN